jgi:hypothetical protein
MVQGKRHGSPRGLKLNRSGRLKSYKVVCAGRGKGVVVQVSSPGDKKRLCMECLKK